MKTKTKKTQWKKAVSLLGVCVFIVSGCFGIHDEETRVSAGDTVSVDLSLTDTTEETGEEKTEEAISEDDASREMETENFPESGVAESEPEMIDADWSEYFGGVNGSAVIYDAADGRFTVYNREAAEIRRSPCSTFKIISSLIALEDGIIVPEDSVRAWSGEVFWNEDWNKDIDFQEAFRTSCVWYFRQVVDDIGRDRMQSELERLRYGNCDISDWEGRLNTNNDNRSLTGFWLESSLLISPLEQTEVMERIFGESSVYSEEARRGLKEVMLVPVDTGTEFSLYGKTGTGAENGSVVDAWFTGFAEKAGGKVYFCVHLDRTEEANVSSPLAREIAAAIVSDYYS